MSIYTIINFLLIVVTLQEKKKFPLTDSGFIRALVYDLISLLIFCFEIEDKDSTGTIGYTHSGAGYIL